MAYGTFSFDIQYERSFHGRIENIEIDEERPIIFSYSFLFKSHTKYM